MRILIVEDDRISRLIMQEFLREFGTADIAVNGAGAVEAVHAAMEKGEPYDLICLDIMMPGMDGQQALQAIRGLEESRSITTSNRSKIIMTTALSDMKSVAQAYRGLCDAYLVKPIDRAKLLGELRNLGLIR